MCCTPMPLLVHDQRVGDDVDDDDKRSRSEDLVRDPRVRVIPLVVVGGGDDDVSMRTVVIIIYA